MKYVFTFFQISKSSKKGDGYEKNGSSSNTSIPHI